MGIRKLRLFGFIFLFFTILLAGCQGADLAGSVTEQKEKKPSKIHQTFLYFTEEFTDDEGFSVGSLFLKTLGGSAVDKVATDVKDGEFMYDNEQNKVLFISSENTLYEYEKGKDKVKLAEDVRTYQLGNKKVYVTYNNEWDDLYIIKEDKDVEKIASNVSQYNLIDNDLYYVNHDGSFKMYNIETRVEEDIATDVYYFVNFNKNKDLAYINDDFFLYYRNGKDGEIVKISSDSISPENVQLIDNKLVYLGTDSSNKMSLFTSDITGSGKTDKIASDVMEYMYVKGAFYYINYDDNLYRKKANEDAATKVASEVHHINMDEKGNIYIGDGDLNLYKLDAKDNKEKVATKVEDYTLTSDGDVIYYNDNNELFLNDQKLVSDLEDYAYLYGSLVYSTADDKLFIKENMKEEKVVDEDLSAYSTAYYHNALVYNNLLDFKDIAGVWRMDNDIFIEIDKNGKVTSLTHDHTIEHEVLYADFQTLYVRSEEDEYFDIIKTNNDSLTFSFEFGEEYATRSSQAEADEYMQEMMEAEDREEVHSVVSEYVYYFERAVNYGDSSYITDYISPSSAFYDQQVAFVQDLYDRNIEEEILDYEILEINKVSDDEYEVTVYEKFSIYNWETYEETVNTYKNRYTVKRIDGEFLITDMVVGHEGGEKL